MCPRSRSSFTSAFPPRPSSRRSKGTRATSRRISFAIQPNARALVEKCNEVMGVGATYVQATPDLMMGDLLKNMRSSQIFSVCGLPEIELRKVQNPKSKVTYAPKAGVQYQVELVGLDVFDPISMQVDHQSGND